MKNITDKFALPHVDHDELFNFLGLRFGTAWQISKSEFDLPASKEFALRVRHDHGRINMIHAGPALSKKKDIDVLMNEIAINLRDQTIKEYGRGTLIAARPVRGSHHCRTANIQFLPPEDGTPLPDVPHAHHPFIIEFPIQAWQDRRIRNWRRYKLLVEWAWVLSVLLEAPIEVQSPRPRHTWVRTPGADGTYHYASEVIPDAVRDIYAPQLSSPGPELPVIPATTYYANWAVRARANLPTDEFIVPDNLDVSLTAFNSLVGDDRDRFLVGAATVYLGSQVWDYSISAYFLACVQAIEGVAQDIAVGQRRCNLRRPLGATQRFKRACELHGAAAGVDRKTLNRLYDLRSDLTHGEYIFDIDRRPWGLGSVGSVLGLDDFDAAGSAARLVKAVLRSWLFSRAT